MSGRVQFLPKEILTIWENRSRLLDPLRWTPYLLNFISHLLTAHFAMSVCLSFFFSLLRAEVQPASGPQHWDHVMVQCASPRRGGEMVGVCMTYGEGPHVTRKWTACRVFTARPSRPGLLSGLALTGTVCCASQWPAKSIYCSSRQCGYQPLRC